MTISHTLSAADPLALDPLSPIAIRTIGDTSSRADPLALDPLSPSQRVCHDSRLCPVFASAHATKGST
jgi:hypothetical protein